MNPGDRVEYIGNVCPMLKGRRGTFQRIDRKGWALVLFDCAPVEPTKCAPCNIKLLEEVSCPNSKSPSP